MEVLVSLRDVLVSKREELVSKREALVSLREVFKSNQVYLYTACFKTIQGCLQCK